MSSSEPLPIGKNISLINIVASSGSTEAVSATLAPPQELENKKLKQTSGTPTPYTVIFLVNDDGTFTLTITDTSLSTPGKLSSTLTALASGIISGLTDGAINGYTPEVTALPPPGNKIVAAVNQPIASNQGLPEVAGNFVLNFTASTNDQGVVDFTTIEITKFTLYIRYDNTEGSTILLPPSPAPPQAQIKFVVHSNFYGNDLGEMGFMVSSNLNYNWQTYPKANVGDASGIGLPPPEASLTYFNIFSFTPDLQSVVLGGGCVPPSKSTLYAQTKLINDTGLDNGTFFARILIYSTARFALSGLLFGCFDVDQLTQAWFNRFIATLAKNTDLNGYLSLFTDPQYGFVGYEKYFKCGTVMFPCEAS